MKFSEKSEILPLGEHTQENVLAPQLAGKQLGRKGLGGPGRHQAEPDMFLYCTEG